MKRLAAVVFLLLAGCASPQHFKVGQETDPPFGCIQLREEVPGADC